MCQRRFSRPAPAPGSTRAVTGPASAPAGVAATACESGPGPVSAPATEATAYQRSTPASPVVSAYAGPGCASTSREWWSSGVHGPSGPGAWWSR